MKLNTKSSVTLPARELEMVEDLRKKLGIQTKVGVIRRGLKLLQEQIDRAALRQAYAEASRRTRASLGAELSELDHLAGEHLSLQKN